MKLQTNKDVDCCLKRWPTTSTSSQYIQECLNSCSSNTIYDPVCGTDGITYKNLESLKCRMTCGFDVNIRQLYACSEALDTTTTHSPKIQPEVLRSCLLLCPTTPEYNPVCGTDNITYYNYGKLVCARICGVDVKLERHSPCSKRH
ncbi:unnamed protein product [Euphydryas editha]|uniref:Kazal-like domain-containing protein n=1 Tax=Euphydryas editha TaxID=104508 RepID=A0AAU9TG70_EUPED|nr:unnamed protein product [Euphydryas editha]